MGKKNRLNYSGINGDSLRAVTNDSLPLQKNAINDFLQGCVLDASLCNTTWLRKVKRFLGAGGGGRTDKEPLVHWRAGFELKVMFINRCDALRQDTVQ